MSFQFAKISTDWASQDEDEADEIEYLHHTNKRRYDQCTCHRCMRFRYHKGIRNLEQNLGRDATHHEIQDVWAEVQREAGLA